MDKRKRRRPCLPPDSAGDTRRDVDGPALADIDAPPSLQSNAASDAAEQFDPTETGALRPRRSAPQSRRRGVWAGAGVLILLVCAGLWFALGRAASKPASESDSASVPAPQSAVLSAVYECGDREMEEALAGFAGALDAGEYAAALSLYEHDIRTDAQGVSAAAALVERALYEQAASVARGDQDAGALLEAYEQGREVRLISPSVAENDDALSGGFTALKNGYVLDCVAWLSTVRASENTHLAAAVRDLVTDLEPEYLDQAADEANQIMEAGDFERALDILDMRTSYYPEADLSAVSARIGARLAEAALARGAALMAAGNWTEAADLYELSVEYETDGRVTAALAEARQLISEDLLVRGAALEAAGEWTKAIQLYRTGLAYDADGAVQAALDSAQEGLKEARVLELENKRVCFKDLYAQCEVIETKDMPGYSDFDRVILAPGHSLGRLDHYGVEPQILISGETAYFTILFSREVNGRVDFREVNLVNSVELRASSTGHYESAEGQFSTRINGSEYQRSRVAEGVSYQYFRAVQSNSGVSDISGVPTDLTYFVRRITENAEPLYIRFCYDSPGWADYRSATRADREALGMLWELYSLMREIPELVGT